jgi:sialate O-acetylesterase
MHRPYLLPALAFIGGTLAASAEVSVPAFFSEHAVLQAAAATPVWGKAAPGEEVTVTLGGATAATKAGADGKWRVSLNLKDIGKGPHELVVRGSNELKFGDILVGQVWLCSGQSNIEWPLSGTDKGNEEAKTSANNEFRHFKIEKSAEPTPRDEVKGKWTIAGPETSKNFTGVGYYFGKELLKAGVGPVGLMNCTWGGTLQESWMRPEAMNPELAEGAKKAQQNYEAFQKFGGDYRAWAEKHGRADRPPAPTADFTGDTTGWETVTLPGSGPAGAVWYSRKITLAPIAVGTGLDIFLGDVQGDVRLYWNGKEVGKGAIDAPLHRYGVHGKHITSAEGILAVRIFNAGASTGIAPGNLRFRMGTGGGPVDFKGEWSMKPEFTLPPLTEVPEPPPARPTVPRERHHVASYVYNGMMAPVVGYGIAGALWYQGEGNTERGAQYARIFPEFIQDLRKQWGREDLPFYVCQLPNYGPAPTQPVSGSWAEIREGQAGALKLPHTGLAVLADVGDPKNLHPGNKKVVGERLSRLALAEVYGQKVEAYSPFYESSAIEGAKIRVKFRNAQGLTLEASPDKVFAICGADKKWTWAEAAVEGDTVVIWNDAVPAPIAARYAWSDSPTLTLYNAAALPAAPFRTDDFPSPSANKKY